MTVGRLSTTPLQGDDEALSFIADIGHVSSQSEWTEDGKGVAERD
jgi:hypothetical protein